MFLCHLTRLGGLPWKFVSSPIKWAFFLTVHVLRFCETKELVINDGDLFYMIRMCECTQLLCAWVLKEQDSTVFFFMFEKSQQSLKKIKREKRRRLLGICCQILWLVDSMISCHKLYLCLCIYHKLYISKFSVFTINCTSLCAYHKVYFSMCLP